MVKWLVIYISFIIFFGLIYWFLWLFHPDTFVFNEQYNLHPFSSSEIDSHKNKNLQFFNEKIDSLREIVRFNTNELKIKRKLRDSLGLVLTKSRDLFDHKRWDSIEVWKKKQVPKALKDSLATISKIIDVYKKDGGNDRYILAKFNIERSGLELKIATIEMESSDFILKNLLFFSDSLLLREITNFDTIYNQLEYHAIPDLELENDKLKYDIEHMQYYLLDDYYHRVSLMDFLLFSASNASTVTYGDLIPNSNFTRFLAFLQAIICICLIAFFTDALLRKYLQPPAKGDEDISAGKRPIVEPQLDTQIIEEVKVSGEERKNRRRLRKYAAYGRTPLKNEARKNLKRG